MKCEKLLDLNLLRMVCDSRQLLDVACRHDVFEAVLRALRLARVPLQDAQQEAAQHLAALTPHVTKPSLRAGHERGFGTLLPYRTAGQLPC